MHGLRRAGARIEDIELVLLTHHHLDHSGLAATIAARSGATVAALDRAADYGERYGERSEQIVGSRTRSCATTACRMPSSTPTRTSGTSSAGPRDALRTDIRAQRRRSDPGRRARPARRGSAGSQHDRHAVRRRPRQRWRSSATTCWPASRPTRRSTRRQSPMGRARAHGCEYLHSLRRTAEMPLDRLLTRPRRPGHRPRRPRRRALRPAPSAAATASLRSSRAARRPRTRSPASLWSPRTVAEQPLLVVWEVLGHLDLLLDAGVVTEQVTDDGCPPRPRRLRAGRGARDPPSRLPLPRPSQPRTPRRWRPCTNQPTRSPDVS